MDSAYRSDLQVGGLGFEINNLESGFNSCGVLKLLDIFSIKHTRYIFYKTTR